MGFHEVIAPDEAAHFARLAREMSEIQQERAAQVGHVSRALHVKKHIGLVGELKVHAPELARVGVFAANRQVWPVYVRTSNAASATQSDKQPDARGFAIKLVGVAGKKLIKGLEEEETQDFLFINEPSLPFRTPEEFVGFQRAAKDGASKLLPRLFSELGLRALGVLFRLARSKAVRSFATQSFHTAAPIAFGTTAAKLGLFPLPSAAPPDASGDNFLRTDLVSRVQRGALAWSLKAQFFVDDRSTPIEDASVTWSGQWVELATLTLPKQDPESEQGREIDALVEQLSFDPWHAIAEHRPLGAIMRARAVAYGPSVIARKAAPEPRSVIQLARSA